MYRQFRKLKIIKRFFGNTNSRDVQLLENNVVKKVFYPHQKDNLKWEVQNLSYLKHCPFVPKLLAVDCKNHTVYMTYCGSEPEDTPENRALIKAAVTELRTNWNMIRLTNDGEIQETVVLKNTTIKHGKIFIIDFGSRRWKILGEAEGG